LTEERHLKILVLGSGLMGPAAAYRALTYADVTQVTICDKDRQQLDAAYAQLLDLQCTERLAAVELDLSDEPSARQLMAGFDVAVAALPRLAIPLGIRAAVAVRTPLVDLNWPVEEKIAQVRRYVDAENSLVVPGCGVEPGLTEIMARHLAERLDRIDELHIKCGGIPETPAPPLDYKIVFGGRSLPLRAGDATVCRNGVIHTVPRYSGAHSVYFKGVGECEAWHEGFMPWLLELDALKQLKYGTQMTVRWPGFSEKATLLRDLGLLSMHPVDVDGARVAPKALLDALLYPRVRMVDGDRDITCFRVEAIGEVEGRPCRAQAEMVDRYDEETGFTSMARTTAFTGAIVAHMIARGQIKARGFVTPEKVITGPLFDALLAELATADICFQITTQQGEPLV
jgi:saccharopine dehydrogenase-like NADP-dependent oxidoreductase